MQIGVVESVQVEKVILGMIVDQLVEKTFLEVILLANEIAEEILFAKHFDEKMMFDDRPVEKRFRLDERLDQIRFARFTLSTN